MSRRAAALAGLALLAGASAARAQDPARVGFAAGAPAGWAVALDADGLGAAVARDPADLQAAVPRGPRIRFRVGPAAGPEPAVLAVVGEPAAARIGPFEAVAITVDAEGYRRRIVTAVAIGGLAFRLDLEGPVGSWERDLAAMEVALSAARLSVPPAADAARLQARLASADAGSAAAGAALAWLDRVLADARAGRLVLLPAPAPFRFWPVDPAELRVLLDLLGEPGAGAAPADDGSGLRAALALRDRLAGAAPAAGGVPPSGAAPSATGDSSGADPVLGVETTSAGGGPAAPGSARFEAGRPIRVRFDRLPGTADWLTIVPVGTPDDQFGEWFWSDGSATPGRPAGVPQRSGVLTFAGLQPGDYEVRLYFDWPNGGYRVRGRRPITVVAARAGPPAGIAAPAPTATPTPSAGDGATYGPFTGEWSSESQGYYATIRLTQIGARVTGEMRVPNGRGTIDGSVVGFVLTFTWLMENGVSGGGRFVLTGDGSAFSGTWTDSTGRSAPWNGVRTSGAPPAAGPPPAPNAAAGPALSWESDGGWRADWIPRGDGRTYDVLYTGSAGQQVRAVEEMTVHGDQVWIRRLYSSDGILCQGHGTVQPGGVEVRGTGECPGINAGWSWRLSSAGAPPSAAPQAAGGSIRITAVTLPPSIRSGGPKAALNVWWDGNPRFPVRMVYAPDSCPSGGCLTVTRDFAAPAQPLVFPDAVWCSYSTPITLDYSVWLEDADGVRSEKVNADVMCSP